MHTWESYKFVPTFLFKKSKLDIVLETLKFQTFLGFFEKFQTFLKNSRLFPGLEYNFQIPDFFKDSRACGNPVLYSRPPPPHRYQMVRP